MNKERLLEWAARLAAVAFIVLVARSCYVTFTGADIIKQENAALREELARQQEHIPLVRDTIRDTVEVVTQQVRLVEKLSSVLSDNDRALLGDLGVKVRELSAFRQSGTVIRDTVYLAPIDTTPQAPLHYKDAWAEFWYDAPRLEYSVRDSVAIAVRRLYRHRFLFWKWGTKGYELKAVNFNPHATLRYNRVFAHEKE